MQGLWTMVFRGPKESVRKLNEAILALEENEEYKYIVEDWRFCLEEMDALDEDGDSAELYIDTESSCNITGMDEYFREFVDFAPELEAAYSDCSLEAKDFRNILYSKPGDRGKDAIEFSVSLYRGGDRVHLSLDGWQCYHSNEDEGKEPEISMEDVEQLRAIGYGERDEPLIFKVKLSHNNSSIERTFNSEDGEFVMEYDGDFEDGEDWCWIANTDRGVWLFNDASIADQYRFVLELLNLSN